MYLSCSIESWEKTGALGSVRATLYGLPKATKISLDDYCRANNINDRSTKVLHYLEADRMAADRSKSLDQDGSLWVFSKHDFFDRYSWEPAGYKDRFLYFLNNL